MKLVEIIQPTPEVIRLFQEPQLQAGNFVLALLNSLGQEKANNFINVNAYLETSVGDANQNLEAMSEFQFQIEQSRGPGPDLNLKADYEEAKAKAQNTLIDLHRSKIKLNDLKITLCRFIIVYEASAKKIDRPFHSVEEWMDAASLAEMRLNRVLANSGDRNLQKLLALFITFRSIVCSFDGPAMYIRQIENAISSLDALYEKIRLKMEVVNARRNLVQTRRELSTAKINLTSLQQEVQGERRREEQLAKLLSLQEKSAFPQILVIGLCLVLLSGAIGYFLMSHARPGSGNTPEVLSQRSCREIAKQLEKSPRYQSQVLIFRKFAEDIYFRANPMTCEKLHRLDSLQIKSLGALLKVDYAAGNQGEASYNGNRVLQVKDVGINKLVVKLLNKTATNVDYKVKVLERANSLRALLEPDKQGLADDLLIVDLSQASAESEW